MGKARRSRAAYALAGPVVTRCTAAGPGSRSIRRTRESERYFCPLCGESSGVEFYDNAKHGYRAQRGHKLHDWTKDDAVLLQLSKLDYSTRQLAERFGVTVGCVWQRMKKLGIPTQAAKRRMQPKG